VTADTSLGELARLFLKLGTISVGGPAAHIALMREEVVDRRAWLSPQEFLDLISATNLIPGPNSTEMAIHIGLRRAGWRGLLVAGGCFILPAVLIVAALAALYVRVGTLPETQALSYGLKPVVIGIVGVALFQLGHTALRRPVLAVLAAAALIAVASGVHELIVLAVGAAAGASLTMRPPRRQHHGVFSGGGGWLGLTATVTTSVAVPLVSFGKLFWVFFKAGAFLFGSGYVLLAFLRADLVERLHWLTEQQLLDAVTIGQMTPGPVFTTATFVGYLVGGGSGAAIATIAIFLPAFVYVAVSAPLLPRLRRSTIAAGALDGVNAASLSLMAFVATQLARSAVVDVTTLALTAASIAGIVVWRVNSAWLLGAGALVGVARFLLA
jgi:chromate transporter